MDLEQPQENHAVSRRGRGAARAIGTGTTFWDSGAPCRSLLIVVTGVIMSYPWANNLLYRATGNTPPPPQTAGQAARNAARRLAGIQTRAPGSPSLRSLKLGQGRTGQAVYPRQPAGSRLDDHQPAAAKQCYRPTYLFYRSRRWRPSGFAIATHARSCQRGNRSLGTLFQLQQGRQLRAWARFTHTGEAGGWMGETLAVSPPQALPCLCLPGSRLEYDG